MTIRPSTLGVESVSVARAVMGAMEMIIQTTRNALIIFFSNLIIQAFFLTNYFLIFEYLQSVYAELQRTPQCIRTVCQKVYFLINLHVMNFIIICSVLQYQLLQIYESR